MPRVIEMRGLLARRLLGAAVIAVLLGPVAWTRQTCADDWADETGPTDNPRTPGPDVYPNKRVEDGVVSMPNLMQSAPALAPVELVLVPTAALFVESDGSHLVEVVLDLAGAPRAPPAPSPA